MAFIVEVLPAPFAPMMPTDAPPGTVKLMPRTAETWP